MKKGGFFQIWFLGLLFVNSAAFGQSSTSYDVEFSRICLVDSIAPDTMVQFWRFTQANNPGAYTVDVTFDLGGSYIPEGTLLPCCSCLTEITYVPSSEEERTLWAGVRLKHTLWGLLSLAVLVLILRVENKPSKPTS